ncbi:PREDICTED: putative uncharacterized protein DDB_G0282133 [Polistes dominula]|uniref:Uncharacterized protein n=1 Tax=Polistes dominula TaxID=743375 RepID=A0ABM1J483_POLDO|nr:PREDICTED: putative uncharacterized protein DDB_G0282133 [Polistes dominula]
MKPTLIECSWNTMWRPIKKTNDDKNYDKKVTDNHYNRERRFWKNYKTRIEARREFFENYETRMLNGNYGVQEKDSYKFFQTKCFNNIINNYNEDEKNNNENQLVLYLNHNDRTESNAGIEKKVNGTLLNSIMEKICDSSRYQVANDQQDDKSCRENDIEKEMDESFSCESKFFWEDDDCHCLSSVSKQNNEEELYNCNRRDSLGDVINCINDKILPSCASLQNVLPVTEAAAAAPSDKKYNLDSTNMNLIYSLTPPSSEMLTVCFENNNVDSIKNSFDVEHQMTNEWKKEVNKAKSDDSSHNSSIENIFQDDSTDNNSIVDDNDKCSNNGSDILELPTGTILELEDFFGESFSEDMNSSVNQILADLNISQACVEAANIVDQVIDDASRLTSNLNVPSKNTVSADNSNLIVINELVHHVLEMHDMEDTLIVSTPKIDNDQKCIKKSSIILQDSHNNINSRSIVVNNISGNTKNSDVNECSMIRSIDQTTYPKILDKTLTCTSLECHFPGTLPESNKKCIKDADDNMISKSENIDIDVDENLNVRVITENDSQNNKRPLSDEIVLEFCSITNRSSRNDVIELNFQIEKSQCDVSKYLFNETSKDSRKRKHCELEYPDRETNENVVEYQRNLQLSNNFKKNFKYLAEIYGEKIMEQYCLNNGWMPIIDNKSMISNGNVDSNDLYFDHYNDHYNDHHQYQDLSPITEETTTSESLNEETNVLIDTCPECFADCSLKRLDSSETIITSFMENENMNVSGEESNKSTDYYTCKDESSEYNTSSVDRPSSCSDYHFQDSIDQVSISSDATYVICPNFESPSKSPSKSPSNSNNRSIISIKDKESVEQNDNVIRENIELVISKSSPVLVNNNGIEQLANLDLTGSHVLPRYEDSSLYRLVSGMKLNINSLIESTQDNRSLSSSEDH